MVSLPSQKIDPETLTTTGVETITQDETCFSCKNITTCKFTAENAHQWIATIAGVITVISGIIAILIIFLNSSSETAELTNTLTGECQCSNGVASFDCVNTTKNDCESCEIGFVLVAETKICAASCPIGQHISEIYNQCVDNTCECMNGNTVETCFEHGGQHCESCDFRFHLNKTESGAICSENICSCENGVVVGDDTHSLSNAGLGIRWLSLTDSHLIPWE